MKSKLRNCKFCRGISTSARRVTAFHVVVPYKWPSSTHLVQWSRCLLLCMTWLTCLPTHRLFSASAPFTCLPIQLENNQTMLRSGYDI